MIHPSCALWTQSDFRVSRDYFVQQLAAPAQHELPGKQHAAPAWQQSWLLVQHVLSVCSSRLRRKCRSGSKSDRPMHSIRLRGHSKCRESTSKMPASAFPANNSQNSSHQVVMSERRFMMNSSAGNTVPQMTEKKGTNVVALLTPPVTRPARPRTARGSSEQVRRRDTGTVRDPDHQFIE